MAPTIFTATLLIFACHVALITGDYVGPMPEPDKSTLEAVKAAVLEEGNFPSIRCYGGESSDYGFWSDVPFRCDDSGRVYTVYLPQKYLGGTIAAEIGNLAKLRYLDLGSNLLSGSIPSSIGNLESLYSLYLDGNELSGNIPSSIGNLRSLQYLVLSYNQLSGNIPSSIGNLILLKTLDLNNNKVSGSIPSSIGDLGSLEGLTFYSNQLSGSIPSSIGNLKSLYYLYLDNNQLSGSIPSSIGDLPLLRFFSVHSNFFTGLVTPINTHPPCSELAANCLLDSSLPKGCAPNEQRSRSTCEGFCNATQPGGPCGGGGICSNGTNGPSCACNEGYDNEASEFTCKLVLPQPSPRRPFLPSLLRNLHLHVPALLPSHLQNLYLRVFALLPPRHQNSHLHVPTLLSLHPSLSSRENPTSS